MAGNAAAALSIEGALEKEKKEGGRKEKERDSLSDTL
jgi:hypothetical protein